MYDACQLDGDTISIFRRTQTTYISRSSQHIGSVWGHDRYLASNQTADVLHRWELAIAYLLRQYWRYIHFEPIKLLYKTTK